MPLPFADHPNRRMVVAFYATVVAIPFLLMFDVIGVALVIADMNPRNHRAKVTLPSTSPIDLDDGHAFDADTQSYYRVDAAGNKVHVESYVRKDGTVVRAHDRALPGAGAAKAGGVRRGK